MTGVYPSWTTTNPIVGTVPTLLTLRNKREQLHKALRGLIGPHQKMMLAEQLRHIDFLSEQITRLDAEIKQRMLPFEEDLERLESIPGVGRRTAEHILAETGTDMSRFSSAAHLCSWAGVAPGNNESAGKRKSGRTRPGNKKLRSALTEAARAAARTKNTYLSAQYHRIAARRGANRASIAVAHSILEIVYYLLSRKQTYVELGANYFDERKSEIVTKRLVKRLEALGHKDILEALDTTVARSSNQIMDETSWWGSICLFGQLLICFRDRHTIQRQQPGSKWQQG